MMRSKNLKHFYLLRQIVVALVLAMLASVFAGCASGEELTVPGASEVETSENADQGNEILKVTSTRPTDAVALEAKNPLLPAAFEPIAQTENLELHARLDNGEVAIVNRADSSVWYSNPQDREEDEIARGALRHAMASQIIAIFSNTIQAGALATSSFNVLEKGELTWEKIPGGIVFWYDFVNENFAVPVRFVLDGDYFEASILTDEIVEREDCQVLTLELLPYFGASSSGNEGYIFIPDGSGALINLNNGMTTADSYEELVYGPNELQPRTFIGTYEQQILMPVFGKKVDNSAFLAVIAENEGNCSIKARINGKENSYNAVNSKLFFRSSSTVRLPAKNWISKDVTVAERRAAVNQNYTVRYFFLAEEKADYAGMAERYRQYLQDEGNLPKQTLEAGDLPFYIDTYGYVRKKVPVLGIPFNMDVRLTSFDDAREMLDEIAAAGIKNPVIRYSGWEKDSFLYKMPDSARVERAVGSQSDLDSLIDRIEELGGSLYLNSDFVNITKTGHGFNKFEHPAMNMISIAHVAMDYDLAVYDKKYDIRWYLTSPKHLEYFVSRYLDSFDRHEHPYLALQSFGSMVYSDFGINGVSRADVPGLITDAIEAAAAEIPNLMFEKGNIYTAGNARHIVDVPSGSSRFSIADSEVPFYQMVLHGYVSLSSTAINLYSNPDTALLRCLEYGTSPMFSWIAEDSEKLKDTRLDRLYSANYRDWLDFAAKGYVDINAAMKNVASLPITDHSMLADKVYRTVYGDSFAVIINYNDYPVEFDGQTIDALDYVIDERGT